MFHPYLPPLDPLDYFEFVTNRNLTNGNHQSHRFAQRILGTHSVGNEFIFVLQGILKVHSALVGKFRQSTETASLDDCALPPCALSSLDCGFDGGSLSTHLIIFISSSA
jgi:hypothetical protein